MANPATSDRDLASINEARTLAGRAKKTQATLAEFSQEQIDAIVDAMAAAATKHAEASAQAAVDETGYGVVAKKISSPHKKSTGLSNRLRPWEFFGVTKPARLWKLPNLSAWSRLSYHPRIQHQQPSTRH